jgi:hypothetical protein
MENYIYSHKLDMECPINILKRNVINVGILRFITQKKCVANAIINKVIINTMKKGKKETDSNIINMPESSIGLIPKKLLPQNERDTKSNLLENNSRNGLIRIQKSVSIAEEMKRSGIPQKRDLLNKKDLQSIEKIIIELMKLIIFAGLAQNVILLKKQEVMKNLKEISTEGR